MFENVIGMEKKLMFHFKFSMEKKFEMSLHLTANLPLPMHQFQPNKISSMKNNAPLITQNHFKKRSKFHAPPMGTRVGAVIWLLSYFPKAVKNIISNQQCGSHWIPCGYNERQIILVFLKYILAYFKFDF